MRSSEINEPSIRTLQPKLPGLEEPTFHHTANSHFTCAALSRAVSTAGRLSSLSDWLVVAEQVQATSCPCPRYPHEAGHGLYKLLSTQRLHTVTKHSASAHSNKTFSVCT